MPKDPLIVGQVVAKNDGDVLINSDGELVGGFAATGLILDATNTTDPAAEGGIAYVAGTGFRAFGIGGVFTIPTSGGGGGVGSLDDAYDVGSVVTVDAGAVVWNDATAGALDTMTFTKSGAGSGDVLAINVTAALTGNAIALDMDAGVAASALFIDCGAGARTGSDILVTDDSTGAHSVIDINSSGAGATIGFDWTGSLNGSPGGSAISITQDNADNLDTNDILITRGTGIRTAPALNIDDASTGSADLIDIDLTGIYTGNVIDFASAAAATGNVINMNLDNALAMTGLHIEGSGVRTQPMVEIITDSTSSASLVDISVDGAITGTAAIDIDMNAGLAANALFIDVGGGARTANVIDITNDGTGNVDVLQIADSNTGSGHIFDINVTSTRSGDVLNVVFSGVATGDALNVDMDANLAGSFLVLDYGGGLRTEDMCQVTYDGTGTNPFWDINITNTGAGATSDYWDIDVSGVFTGSILDVNYSAAATGDAVILAMGSAVAASALQITGAGIRTDDLVKINTSDTGAAHVFDINMSGAGSGNVLDVVYSAAAHTGHAISIGTGTNLAGNAMLVTTAGVRTAPVINIVGAATDAGADDHIFFVTQSGLLDSNLIQLTYDTAASTGEAISVAMGTNVAGRAIAVTSAGTGVSGEGSVLDVTHTGVLVGGADVVNLTSSGAISATSNVLAIDFTNGDAGSYGLYISAANNGEAIHVDAGTVLIDETITVTGGYGGTHIGTTITTTAGAGAVALTGQMHEITTTGVGDAMTLANGTAGQRIKVIYVAEAGGADTAILTPTTFAGGTTITFNTLGDSADLVYSATGGWYMMGGTAAVA